MRDGRKNGTDRIPLSFVGFATWFERIKACPAYEHPVGLTTARFDIGAEAVTAVRVEGLRRGFQGEGGRGRMRPVALITRSHCCGRLFIINRSKAGLWRRQIWRPIKYRRRDGAQTRRGISLSWNFLWPFRIKTASIILAMSTNARGVDPPCWILWWEEGRRKKLIIVWLSDGCGFELSDYLLN